MTDLVAGMSLQGAVRGDDSRRHAGRAGREARRSQLQSAATEMFILRGYHGACMDEIAERAGVSKPTLYQHFSGKLDLYLAVVRRQSDVLVGEVLQALRSTTDTRGRLRAAVQAYFDFVDDNGGGFRLIFESDVITEPSVQRVVDHAQDACVNAVHGFVSDAAVVDNTFARVLAVGLVGASQAAARYWLDAGRGIAKEDAVDATVVLCWNGISGLPLRTERVQK